MLRMNVHQLFAQFSHLGQGNRSVIDESPALAGTGQFTADDGVFCIKIDVVVVEETLHVVSGEVEMSLNHATVLARLDGLAVGTVAQQQADGSEDDAFACTRFASDDREAWIQSYIQFVYERKVSNIQLLEHNSLNLFYPWQKAGGFIPLSCPRKRFETG